MSYSKFVKSFTSIAIIGAVGLFAGCNSGDTDGGTAEDNLGTGNQPVSDGGFGASLTINLEDGGDTIPTAGRERFFVTALDPAGIPLGFRRVFCDSELGIAILEPSSGGVAFEHTNQDGVMSGILGGVTPGSFLIECRLEEGFNLVARKTLRVQGDVPPGFTGFAGAAGGNLGGGSIQENPNDGRIVSVTINGSANGPVDIVQNLDCENDGNVAPNNDDIEEYSFDTYEVSVNNNTGENLTIRSVTFTLDDGRGVTSTRQLNGVFIAKGETGDITGTFTEFVLGTNIKVFAGTAAGVIIGTYNVTFTIEAETDSGDDIELTGSTSVTFGDIDNC